MSGIKTEAAERVLPMLPALYDVLIDHKAEFGYRAHDPVFATRNGRRNTVDNVRRTIVDLAVRGSNALLVARDQREIVRCTPHTLRRTFASILAEVKLPPRRAMYLIGQTNPTLICASTSRSWTWAMLALRRLRRRSGARSQRPSHRCRQPAEKNASQPESWSGLEGAETAW